MLKIKRFTAALTVLLLTTGLAVIAPVSAQDGTSNDDTIPNHLVGTHKTTDLTEQLKQQAQEKLQADKQIIGQHTAAERQKACTARKHNLTKHMSNAVSWANKHKGVIDTAYTRVKAFHDSKNLNVPDYDALTAAVGAAQANAQTSIDALKALNVNVDCTSQTVASSVSIFQQSVKNTRDSLKDYRKALVQLIEALKGASTGTNSTSGTENESTSNPTQ